jgi:hypothetical protein
MAPTAGKLSVVLALGALLVAGSGALLIYWVKNAWQVDGPTAPYKILLLLVVLLLLAIVVGGLALVGLVQGVVGIVAGRRGRRGFPLVAILGVLLNLLAVAILVVSAKVFCGAR